MIVVTTPTGQIGKQVTEKLRDLGEPVRVIARDPFRLGRPVRFVQTPVEAFKETLRQQWMSEAVAQGMADMMRAKNDGLDNAEPRTPQSTTPTNFRQWCQDVLKPAVLS